MIYIIVLIILVVIVVILFMRTPVFGTLPGGKRLEQLRSSPNYRDRQFQNRMVTPSLKEGTSMVTVLRDFFFNRSPRNKPSGPLPVHKTDLHDLELRENVLVWFGHSSYYFQVDGKKFLVDPVLSGHASPVSFLTKSFPGSNNYSAADIPSIDYLILTHDHYDHLDYQTIIQIKDRVGHIITGLGTGAHLERWQIPPSRFTEMDWEQSITLPDGFRITATTARHFSGRTFKRNTAIWLSLVLQTPSMNIFLGGDSGYGTHFNSIGESFGPFDLAILECGQYNEYWKYIHMMPEEVIQAGIDLKAKCILPVHWAKFALALHAWDDPINRANKEAANRNVPILTPMIGEKLYLDRKQTTGRWWEQVS